MHVESVKMAKMRDVRQGKASCVPMCMIEIRGEHTYTYVNRRRWSKRENTSHANETGMRCAQVCMMKYRESLSNKLR